MVSGAQVKWWMLGLASSICFGVGGLPVEANPHPLVSVPVTEIPEPVGYDAAFEGDRQALLQAVNASLSYLNSPAAQQAYATYPVPGITYGRVYRSVTRFRDLVRTATDAAHLQTAVRAEFDFFQAIGTDTQGTVEFTGYFTPTYQASPVPTPEYRYPLFRPPANFNRWQPPHPTRAELEGCDGLGWQDTALAGYELVWLRDRLEAFLIQVQGSARLQLTDGGVMSVGYAGSTDWPYTSIGRQLVADGIYTLEELTLPLVLEYFDRHPEALDLYIPRNQRFIFFEATAGAPPTGSLGWPVVAGRSIATDKSLMPPGALAVLFAALPEQEEGGFERVWASRYVLDHDTGSAIRGPGRADIFVGIGDRARAIAGEINTPGQLYYLLLRE